MTKRNDNASEATVKPTSDLNEWGIPNWCDAKTYGNTEDWTLYRWRWEFFRRRSDLREFFDQWAADTHQKKMACNIGLGPCDAGFLAFGPAALQRKASKEFDYLGIPNPRIGSQPAGAILPRSRLLKRSRLINGAKRHAPVRGILDVTHELSASQFSQWLEPHEVTIKFDLNKPLQGQIEEAHELVRSHQKRLHGKLVVKRQHRKKWLGYLRTLDACEARASWAKIAALHPATAQSEQSARDIWEQAKALCFDF
ncbi:hypothetical protein ACS3QZ_14245 [Shimia sp. W99]